ncbi:MAG: S41 family peptidase, partial [Planctomycetaceae bacterium]
PPSYEDRSRAAINGLVEALNNPAFLQVAGDRSGGQTGALQSELTQLANNPAHNANDSVGLMQYVAQLASQRAGLRQEAVALEFINETIDALDKYSALIPAKTGAAPGASLEEQVVGIGVELKKHESGALINDIIPNSPASEGGLQKGDVIMGINNQNTAGMTLDQVANLIGGPSGSTVTLMINRNGGQGSVSLRRRSVYVSSVNGAQMLSNDVGYVRLKQFSESAKADLEKNMLTLYRQGMRSLVLDLRGNPGGLLDQAIDISDLFLPSGHIVETRGRNSEDNSDATANWDKTWSTPVVLLVDGDSASASEIFAAAIQENGRGVIVGRKTYGKGTVQTHFPLRTISGELKLTTAKFYSPTGREMAGPPA